MSIRTPAVIGGAFIGEPVFIRSFMVISS